MLSERRKSPSSTSPRTLRGTKTGVPLSSRHRQILLRPANSNAISGPDSSSQCDRIDQQQMARSQTAKLRCRPSLLRLSVGVKRTTHPTTDPRVGSRRPNSAAANKLATSSVVLGRGARLVRPASYRPCESALLVGIPVQYRYLVCRRSPARLSSRRPSATRLKVTRVSLFDRPQDL